MLEKVLELLTKDKEVQCEIVDYDFETKQLIAQMNNKRALIALEDISLYQKNAVTNENIDSEYFQRLLGTYTRALIKGYKNNSIILSRAELMKKRIEKYATGDVVIATVTSADSNALYIEFDEGLAGKIYTNQLTSSKLKQPLDLYRIGDKIKCKITKIKENNYFELSRIELYKKVSVNIKRGESVKCKITKKLDDDSGYFVELASNPLYSGIFDITKTNAHKNYIIGQTINLKVLDIDNKRHLKLRAV